MMQPINNFVVKRWSIFMKKPEILNSIRSLYFQ